MAPSDSQRPHALRTPSTRPNPCQLTLDLTNTSGVSNIRACRRSTRNSLSLEVDQEICLSTTEASTATKRVKLASMAKVSLAHTIRARRRRREKLPFVVKQWRVDILKHIALGNNHTASFNIKRMTCVAVEVVVYSVEQRVALSTYFGAAARGVMDVVALHSDEIAAAEEEDAPVVTAVTGGGPGGAAVEFRVADCYAARGAVAGYEHLAADEGDLDVVWRGC